ncbi:MAG TPA: HAD-IA family hydrolase, partial [Methanofastidiosum sp.]|nr:HAD-IA family hydrolase [Methanofastidiosum sp.]
HEGYDKYGFNLYGYNKFGYDKKGYDKEGFDKYGFNIQGIHRDTGTIYDREGCTIKRYVGSGANKMGYDNAGFDKNGFDREGYGVSGYNKQGFDRKGRHKLTGTMYDPSGFDRDGYTKFGYDIDGYDREGFNKKGFDRGGYNKDGYNLNGVFKDTGTIYAKDGFTIKGFNKDGIHKITGTIYNEKGFDKNGRQKITNKVSEIKKSKKDPNSTIKNPNLELFKKNISDSFDCLYYQSYVNASGHRVTHYFIDYYVPKSRGEYQNTFSLNILNFKRDTPLAVRDFSKIVNSIVSIENISAKYVIPIPSSTKDKISMSIKELGTEVADKNKMKYIEALNRHTSVKSSHLAQGDRPTYQDHYNSINCMKSFQSEKVLLLDDVYTMGSTAQACIDKLIGKGVGDIVLITLGKTIGHEDNAVEKYPITQKYDKQLGIPKNIKGIIFDLDGTLVDSSMLKSLRDNYKWKEARENIHQIIEFEGVSEILSDLKKKYKLGLVTSSPEIYASSIVKMMNWNFSAYVFYHDTQNHKPHPEPLIECAKKLGLKPGECLAVGDEIIDIQAARKAGMKDAAAIWNSSEKNKLIDFKPLLIYEYPKDLIGKRQD